jgi:hypothetical protein
MGNSANLMAVPCERYQPGRLPFTDRANHRGVFNKFGILIRQLRGSRSGQFEDSFGMNTWNPQFKNHS